MDLSLYRYRTKLLLDHEYSGEYSRGSRWSRWPACRVGVTDKHAGCDGVASSLLLNRWAECIGAHRFLVLPVTSNR